VNEKLRSWQPVDNNQNNINPFYVQMRIQILYDLVNDLGRIINNAATMINKMEDIELKKIYTTEIAPIITDYNAVKTELATTLQEYFEVERQSGAPVDLTLRHLYKQVITP
jgi:hypothetical protein